MHFVSKSIQVAIFLTIIVWIISGWASVAYASWALNTPESQTGVLWAGENLVWNDNRLGSSDIFVRDVKGIVSPLLTGVGDQTVLAAGEKSLLVSDLASGTQNLYIYGLETHVIKPMGQYPPVISSAIFADQAAWSDGETVWWWNGQKLISRLFISKQLLVTPAGLLIMQNDQITLWSSDADQIIPCPKCTKMAPYQDRIAFLDGLGTLKVWPSYENIDVGVNILLSNQSTLIYQSAETTYVYRDQQKIQFDQVIHSNAQIGQNAIASVKNLDVVLDPILPPSAQVSACDLSANAVCSGNGVGFRIIARAVDQKDREFISYLNITDGVWSGRMLPSQATDGTYDISVRAESVFGVLSAWTLAGQILIDSTPPKIVENDVEIQNDRARIHLQTDEKTRAIINLASAEQSITRTQNRLTFSHTTTFNDLDADTQFNVDATLTDVAANSVQSHTTFATPPLTSPSYQISSTFDQSQAGVWEGELVVPPGVIDEKVAIMRMPTSNSIRLIRLQWTIGSPPPLTRHRLVRVKGRVNSAGTAILAHRARAIAVIDATFEDPQFNSVSNAELELDQFIQTQGRLTSVTKTGWQIEVGPNRFRVHWENPPNNFSRGDVIDLKGYTFLAGQSIQIAGISAVLIEKALPKTVAIVAISKIIAEDALVLPETPTPLVTQPSITFATIKLTKIETTLQNNLSERTITMQTASVYDKNENSWYNLALYGVASIINLNFFFRRRDKTRRA